MSAILFVGVLFTLSRRFYRQAIGIPSFKYLYNKVSVNKFFYFAANFNSKIFRCQVVSGGGCIFDMVASIFVIFFVYAPQNGKSPDD